MQEYDYGQDYSTSAAQSAASERATFIRRVYAHLAGAILAFIAVEALLLSIVPHDVVLRLMMGGQFSWLIVMVLFMGAGYVASSWAQSRSSRATQYMGLGLFVLAEAVIFMPLMIYATLIAPDVIPQAGVLTGAVFGGLTLAVFVTKKDFSFLGAVVSIGFMIMLGVAVAGILFGFTLGLLFSLVMVALVSASILYNTSNVMLYYPTDMYVAAALRLFADVATLFWYIVQILLSSRR